MSVEMRVGKFLGAVSTEKRGGGCNRPVSLLSPLSTGRLNANPVSIPNFSKNRTVTIIRI